MNERPDTTGVCCVLWARPGASLPGALLKVLEQRRLSVVSVRHRFAAVSEVVRAHASMARANAATHGEAPAARAPILVFVEPEELDGAAEVFHALELSAPGTLCWRYRQSSVPKLGMFLASEVSSGESVMTSSGSPAVSKAGMSDSTSGGTTRGADESRVPEIVVNPAISLVMREPGGSSEPRLSFRPSGDDGDRSEFGSTGRNGSEDFRGISGRTPGLRLAGGDAERVQGSPETPDIRGGAGAGTAAGGANRAAPLRPREREDFSRIITEEELTMLLADRDTKG